MNARFVVVFIFFIQGYSEVEWLVPCVGWLYWDQGLLLLANMHVYEPVILFFVIPY